MTDEAWIQNSLSRLEALEQQRPEIEARGDTAELARVDAEIHELYRALEAVAQAAEDEGDDEDDEPTVMRAPAASTAPPADSDPPSAQSPFAQPSAPPPLAADEPMYGATDDDIDDIDDIDVGRSKTPMVVGTLAVAAAAFGGWYFLGRQPDQSATSSSDGESVKVIKATEVGQDTQEPKVAEGAEADRTPGTRIRPTAASRQRPSRPRRAQDADDDTRPAADSPDSLQRDRDSRIDVDKGDDKDLLSGLE